jgi:ferric iron reductase protein FhuF
MTEPLLAQLLTGPLARYAETLLSPGTPCDAMPGERLLDPDLLTEAMERFGRRYAGPVDRRACASVWAKHHFAAWLVPGLAVNLLRDHDLPLALREVEVVLAPEGQTAALRLTRSGRMVDPLDRFATLRDGHLAPLIAAASRAGGITPRVLWSNAGNVFENVVRTVERLAPQAPGLAEADRMMATRALPDGRLNPLFMPVRYSGGHRQRRVCCLRYLIAELDYCSTCPLPAARGGNDGS